MTVLEERNMIVACFRKNYPTDPISIRFFNSANYRNMFYDKIHNKYYRYNIIAGKLYLAKVDKRGIGINKALIVNQEVGKKNYHNIKTNHGKVSNIGKTSTIITLLALLALGAAKKIDKIQADSLDIPYATVIESNESFLDEPVIDEVLVEDNEVIQNNNEVVIPVEYQGTKDANRERRLETENLYGDTIKYYTSRYGLPYSLITALFTQERYFLDSSSLQTKRNIGSLTNINCVKMTAPVISNGEVVGEDKIYVLPKSYDKFKLEDLHTMIYDKRDFGDDLIYIKEADKLQQEGYQIYCNRDIYDVNNNIKIACIYIRNLIEKKKDIIKGIMSYNMGPNRISLDTTYEDILYGKIDGNGNGDPLYLNHIAQYLLEDELYVSFSFMDGTTQKFKIIKSDTLELGASRK